MNRPPRNHYDNLGVPPNATRAEIEAAFRKLTKILHPDVTGVKSALFDAVVEAHEVLLDPVRRAAYDRLLSGPTPSTPSHAGGRPGGDPGGRGANEATAPGGGHGSARTGSAGARWTGAGAATAVWRRPPNFKDLAAAHTTRLVLRAREILSTPWRSVAGVLAFALTAGLCSLSWAHLSQALGFLPDDRPVGIRHAAVVYVDLTPPLPGPTSWWVLGFFLVFGLVLALRLGVTAEDVRPRVMVAVAQLLSLLYLAYSIGSTMTRGLEYGSGSPTLLLVRHPYLIPWVPGVVTGSLAAAYMWWSVWRTVRIARAQRAFAAALIRAKQEARWLIRQAPSRSSGQRARPAGASDAGRRRTPAIGDIWWGGRGFRGVRGVQGSTGATDGGLGDLRARIHVHQSGQVR